MSVHLESVAPVGQIILSELSEREKERWWKPLPDKWSIVELAHTRHKAMLGGPASEPGGQFILTYLHTGTQTLKHHLR